MNSKIEKAAAENKLKNAATAMRMQYGFGDEVQLKQLDDILNGKTVLGIGNVNGEAQTDMENGKRTVYLNNYKTDMTREEQLAIGIKLGHEAYRDGIVGTKEEQMAETRMAVNGHTDMASKMLGDDMYTKTMTNLIGNNQNLQMDLLAKSFGDDVFNRYVDGTYDSSADYWLLKTDGTIVWDGSKDLNVQYYKEDGTTDTKYGHIKDTTGSFSQALLNYVGEERGLQVLSKVAGKEISSISDFSDDVIKSVTGMNSDTLEYLKENHPVEYQQIYSANKDKLIAEALMYNQGKSWSSKGWSGTFDPLKMSDYDIGQIVVNKNADGTYDRFGITAEVYRDEMSYLSTRNNTVNYKSVNGNQGLDSIYLYKRDLNGNIIDSTIYEDFSQGWQTVANGFADPDMKIPAYPIFNIKDGYIDNVYRGSTVVEDQSFNMRFGNFTSDNFGGNTFIINRAQTLSELMAGNNGLTLYSSDPLKGHSNYLQGKKVKIPHEDTGGLISAGCFMNKSTKLNDMNNWVMNNVSYPYDIKAIVKNKRNSIEPVYGPGRR